MGGIEALFAAFFGILWTYLTIQYETPFFFSLFGVGVVIFSAISAVYEFYNAGGSDRFSLLDITSKKDESDPLDQLISRTPKPRNNPSPPAQATRKYPGSHCPFCGEKVGAEFNFCPKCGGDI
jgi:hypothetical protein